MAKTPPFNPSILSSITARPVTALSALSAALTRRVDLVMIGDSNQRMDGSGFGGAFMKGLHTKFGCYATAVGFMSPASVSTYATSGEIVNGPGVTMGATATGADAGIEAIFPSYVRAVSGVDTGLGYGFIPSGVTVTSNTYGGGVNVDAAHGIGVSNALKVHYAWLSQDSGAGSFQIKARLGGPPFSQILLGPVTPTNTGEFSLHRGTLDIAAATRTTGIECRWFLAGGSTLTGPAALAWMRLENPTKLTGVCVNTLYGVGGQSLCDMADWLQQAPDKTLTQWFSEVRRLQLLVNQVPMVVIYINSGLNDKNETLTSMGWRASTVGDSATAYIDNLEAIAKRITDIWQINGWDDRELYWLIMPSHPIAAPDDSELVSYRRAAASFCGTRQRTSFVDLTNLTSYTEMAANGWYRSGLADLNHESPAGYAAITARVLALTP